MDRSIQRLPDPVPGAPNGERRRFVRQKLHTPVYASFNGPQTGMVVDLSELLDLHEEGFAVQTAERLETNRAVTICLDLPETRSFIHGTGQVIWSDDTGRGGIRFSALPENARQVLKEWLFANLLIGCSNHQARTEQRARHEEENEEEKFSESEPVLPSSALMLVTPITDQSESLLETVRREVREIGDDFDAVLQLVTERVLSLTGASGAALAFLTDDKMICRARAGEPAPPLGAAVDIKQGLSGECVRTGLLVSCEDTEDDPRVDPEVSRALAIGSLMASPIVSDFRVVGLLEIFSPLPHSFTKADGTVLDRLVEMIPKTHWGLSLGEKMQLEAPQTESLSSPEPAPEELQTEEFQTLVAELSPVELDSLHATREALWEDESEDLEEISQPGPVQVESERVPDPLPESLPETVSEPTSSAPARLVYRALIGLVILAVAVVVGYVVAPMVEKRSAESAQAAPPPLAKGAGVASPVSLQSAPDRSLADYSLIDHGAADRGTIDERPPAKSVAALQALANHGNADAQWQLGVRYHNGEGVPKNDSQAMLWFQLAAEQGHVTAQATLGAYYWAGRGVPQDLSKAYFWSTLALAQGDENSKSRLEGLASQMTKAQVAAARQQAEVWIRTHSQRAKGEAN